MSYCFVVFHPAFNKNNSCPLYTIYIHHRNNNKNNCFSNWQQPIPQPPFCLLFYTKCRGETYFLVILIFLNSFYCDVTASLLGIITKCTNVKWQLNFNALPNSYFVFWKKKKKLFGWFIELFKKFDLIWNRKRAEGIIWFCNCIYCLNCLLISNLEIVSLMFNENGKKKHFKLSN